MKRRFTWIAVPTLLLAGCDWFGASSDPEPTATPTGAQTPTPDATGTQVPTEGARQISEETDTFLFEYSYPKEAGEVEELATWLDARLDRARQELANDARRGREQARSNGFPFNQYSSGTAWEVVADLPRWLSLSADLYSYQGGAHPNYGFDAVLWDKQESVALEPIAMFTSKEALDEALGDKLCDALNAERERRRGTPVEAGSDDTFDACVKPDETNLLLGSRGGEKFDRIGIQIAPYLAGPYAEGSYEFDFAMDEELLAIVRPEYRGDFATRP